MATIFAVKAHIDAQAFDALITTRDLLGYGLRNSVDKATSLLVKMKFIRRLARGIFINFDAPDPPVERIAAVKAEAFGKAIVTDGGVLAEEFDLTSSEEEPRHVYQVNGRTSSFNTVYGRIYLKGTVAKKIHGGESTVARVIRAMVSVGKDFTQQQFERALSLLQPMEYEHLVKSARWMPSWLSDEIRGARAFFAPSTGALYSG